MAKLSKQQIKTHSQATEMLQQATLTEDEKYYVLDNWQESATHINSAAGAYFTPEGLASDFAIEVGGRRIIDLCAGSGASPSVCCNKIGTRSKSGRSPALN